LKKREEKRASLCLEYLWAMESFFGGMKRDFPQSLEEEEVSI
jgi:hypothetical protein